MNDELKRVVSLLKSKKVNLLQFLEIEKAQDYNVLVSEDRELTSEEFYFLKERL